MSSISNNYITGKASTAELFNSTSYTVSNDIEEIPPNESAVGKAKRGRKRKAEVASGQRQAKDKDIVPGSDDQKPEEKDIEICEGEKCSRLEDVDWNKLLIPYFTMVVYGRRRIGKSVLVSHILSSIKDRFEDAYVFSQTSEVQPLMWSSFHKTRIHNGYSSTKLADIFQERRKLMEKVNDEFKQKRKKDVGSHKMTATDDKFYKALVEKTLKDTLILLDDIVGDASIRTCKLFQNIFTLGRHYRLSLIILSQNANRRGALNRECTGNADYALTSSMLLRDDYQVLAEQYWGTEGAQKGAAFIADNTNEDYVFLFTDNTNKTKNRKKLTDHTFTFKSPPPEETKRYMIGKKPWLAEKELDKALRSNKRGLSSGPDKNVTTMALNNAAVTHYQLMPETMVPTYVRRLENGPLFNFRKSGAPVYYDE